MPLTARQLTLLAVFFLLAGCRTESRHSSSPQVNRDESAMGTAQPLDRLQPALNKIVGRILSVDLAQSIAVIGLTAAQPPVALPVGTELIARSDDLRETGRLSASRYVRGHTLGAQIFSGQPAAGNEVVYRVP
jgi:hypothetical protein